mmetsp:Transcript_26979/g.87170  ORF Transcript_26979/g.87170 Transcript_26979/m.87170 type:complete len:93 (+) Transcript_26979:343-621(+)
MPHPSLLSSLLSPHTSGGCRDLGLSALRPMLDDGNMAGGRSARGTSARGAAAVDGRRWMRVTRPSRLKYLEPDHTTEEPKMPCATKKGAIAV